MNAMCEQEALGLGEKRNESLKSLKGCPAQSFTPSPRQSPEASAFTWGSCSSLPSYTPTHTDECALMKCKGRTSLVAQWEPVCQRGGHGFDLCSGKIPMPRSNWARAPPRWAHALQLPSPRSATRGAAAVRPARHDSRKPARSTGAPAQPEINNEGGSFKKRKQRTA